MHELRAATKASIRILAKKFGITTILDVARGEKPHLAYHIIMIEEDVEKINSYFKILLDKEPKEAEVEELLDCLEADNSVERLLHRKLVA